MIDRQVLAVARVREAVARLPPDAFLSAQVLATQGGACACPAVETMPAACIELMLSALELSGSERVLEIGSRSGYETALLGQLAGGVVSLVSDAASAEARLRVLKSLGRHNVRIFLSDGAAGWPGEGPYQAIFVAGGVSRLPIALLDQLEVGGRLVIPLGDATGQVIEVVHRRADGVTSRALGTSRLPLLPWAVRRPSFFPWNRERDV